MSKNLSFLVVGKSGHGKSSYIKSFIKNDIKRIFNSEGDGQTTRYLSEYNININDETYSAKFYLLSPDEFIEKRLNGIDGIFTNNSDADLVVKNLKSKLVNNVTDFKITEYDSRNELEDIFNTNVIDIKNEIISIISNKNLNDNLNGNSNENFNNKLVKVIRRIYDVCIAELSQWCKNNNIIYLSENKEIIITSKTTELTKLLKIGDDGKSYSSLIKFASFVMPISEIYKNECKKIDIGTIKFVDTYGLDQFENLSDDLVLKIYKKLLLDQYTDISNVIFIHKANKESAVSLSKNIPLIFDVKPKTMVYVVCTHMDLDGAQNDKGFKELKDIDSQIYIELMQILADKGVGKVIYEHRAKVLNQNIYEYSVKEDKKYSNNIVTLFKKYLKNPLTEGMKIDMELILPEKFKEIFNDDILNNYCEKFNYLPSRTSWALANNLNNQSDRVLGFESTTLGEVGYFSYILYFAVKACIVNISDFDVMKELDDCQKIIIQEIFYIWINQLLYCKASTRYSIYLNSNQCKNCKIKEDSCIVYRLAKEKRELMNNKEYPLYLWFSRIYDFSTVSDDCKVFVKNLTSQIFADKFIQLCEEHNKKLEDRYSID